MRSPGVPQAFTCGLVMLLVVGCTGDTEDPEPQPEDEPAPVPTEFEGDPPPGIEGEVLRYLHGEGADAPDILNDPLGVRISPVGAAFLISSDGEDRHLLHDAATGDTLWEGEARFRGFAEDRDGERVMLMADTDGVPFVLDARGERVWSAQETGDTYLDGVVVRYPDEWSFDEPDGEYTVLDADGDVLWEYEFTGDDAGEDDTSEDEPSDEPSEGDSSEDEGGATDDGADPADDTSGTGVPVAAREDLLLLSDGGPGLQARSLDPDSDAMGEELWAVSGHDEDLGLPASGPLPAPQVVGVYPAVEDPDGEGADDSGDEGASDAASDSDAASGSDGSDDSDGDGSGDGSEESGEQSASDSASGSDADPDADTDQIVLLRWALAESPSTLSAHDADSGELLWTLREPGTNPVGQPFDPAGLTGSLHDAATGTLMLPQASGEATAIAVDTATGEVLWTLEDDDVSISLAFAHEGVFYGDTRTSDGQDEQLVLDALTMDTVSDELTSYVEAVTESGHAVLVQDRQRFVYGPPPQEAEPSEEPETSTEPTEEPT